VPRELSSVRGGFRQAIERRAQWKEDARALKSKEQRIAFDPPYEGDYLQLIERLPSVPRSRMRRLFMKFELTEDHMQASRQLVDQSPNDLRTFFEVRDAARAIKNWINQHKDELTEDHEKALRHLKEVKSDVKTDIDNGNSERRISDTVCRYKGAFSGLLDVARILKDTALSGPTASADAPR
jgi:hypothetical protein